MFFLKLVFANNYYYLRGGSEKVFFDEIFLLKKRGHKVLPFSRRYSQNIENLEYFPPDIEYLNAPIYKKFLASFSLIHSLTCAKYFSQLLDKEDPDIVHGHNIYGRLTTSIIDVAKKKQIPFVLTLHDYKLLCPSYLMLNNGRPCDLCRGRRFYLCLLKRCHKGSFVASLVYTAEAYFCLFMKKYSAVNFFICPSNFLLSKCLEAGVDENKLVYLPNFIPIKEFEPSYAGKDYILFVGRLSQEKGILTLLKAMKGLDIKLKVVGDGPMRPICEQYVRDQGISNVSFEGYKSGKELENLYRNALFTVFPSEWYENAPMSVLESFAYGKPVIGSNIGGVPEMIKDGKTGILFTSGNSNELREKISDLLKHPSLIKLMGQRARKLVEAKFNPDVHYTNLIRIYEKAISNS